MLTPILKGKLMSIKRLDHVNFITHAPEATANFYCNLIGLVLGDPLSIDTSQSLYFYIPGESIAILHIGNANAQKQQPKFKRFAELNKNNQGNFATGAFDHFCLAIDAIDYDLYIEKLTQEKIDYETYCHDDTPLKQIWIIDPNGVRVELNFI